MRNGILAYLLTITIIFPIRCHAQSSQAANVEPQPDGSEDAAIARPPGPVVRAKPKFHHRNALKDSFKFLMFQTGARLAIQAKTRQSLAGPFVKDYFDTLAAGPAGFMDGDSRGTNFFNLSRLVTGRCPVVRIWTCPL